jgi:protocatechuate 3,4-dioxygenase beta subunit
VKGTIVNRDLSNVTVRLENALIDPLESFDGYSATVKADGSFHFHDIAPGAYRLTAVAEVSMFGEYGSRPPDKPGKILQIKPGDHIRDLSLELFPDPKTICGHVTDANGKPLEVNVEEYSIYDGNDGQRAKVELPIRRADANGYFSFPDLGDKHLFFVRAAGVWYPSTEDFAQAIPLITVRQSISGCQADIQVRHSECTGRVLGKFQSALQCPANEFDASLYGVHPSGTLYLADYHPSYLADGVEFEDVCYGSYAIVGDQRGYCIQQDHWQPFASPVFQLNGPSTTVALSEATNEEITKIGAVKEPYTQLSSLTGSVRFEGFTRSQACPAHSWSQVELKNKRYSQGLTASVKASGNFTFHSVNPGNYEMSFRATMHGGAYIKTFEVDGKMADPADFVILSNKSARIEVVFSNDPQGANGHLRGDYAAPLHFLPEGTHPDGSVSGTVTGEAGTNVVVKLTPTRYNSAQSKEYQTVASKSGAFQFASVFPGIYRLFVDGGQYQYSSYGARGPGMEGLPVVLHAHQHLKHLSFAAYRKSSVCGSVFDSEGKPKPGVEVWVQGYDAKTPSSSNGYDAWQRKSVTDDRGRYLITEVGPSPFLWLWAELDGKRTYYPSASDTFETQPIHLGTEDSTCTFDIRLPTQEERQYARGYSVSGVIDGKIDPVLGYRFRVEIASDNPEYPSPVEPGEVGKDGEFELNDVWPGSYTLILTTECDDATVSCDPKYESRFSDGEYIRIPTGFFHRTLASQRITVTNSNLVGLKIGLATLPSLDAVIVFDEKNSTVNNSTINVALLERGAEFEIPSRDPRTEAKLDSSGHFSFRYLNARDYSFHVDNYFTDNYVKSILLDGKPIEGTRIRLNPNQSAHLVAYMATDGASGTIVPGPTDPHVDEYEDQCRFVNGRPMRILMIPDLLPSDDSGILVGFTQTDSENMPDGKYHFSAVPPGNYHILALDILGRLGGLVPGADDVVFESHNALVKLAALGKPVEVKSNQHFEWVAPVVTEQMMRLKAELGLPAGR